MAASTMSERESHYAALAAEWHVGAIGYVDPETTHHLAGERVEVMAVYRDTASDTRGHVDSPHGVFISSLYVAHVRAFRQVGEVRSEIVSIGALLDEDEWEFRNG